MNKVLAIVQARMSSSRLPGKVLLPLGDNTVLGSVFRQLSFSQKLDQAILATSTSDDDDALVGWSSSSGIMYYRGSLTDVLDRYYKAAVEHDAETIVRITADCPLIDPQIVDLCIQEFFREPTDFLTNTYPPSYPDGYDVEVFSFEILEIMHRHASLSSEREHVTPYLRNNASQFKIRNVRSDADYSTFRLTIDNQEDYQLIKVIVDKLQHANQPIYLNEVLNFLNENEELLRLNSHIKRNEGYTKSLKADKS